MTGAGLGWLQGTIRGQKPDGALLLIADAVGAKPEVRDAGTHWYAEGANLGPHALVAWSPRKRPDAAEAYIEVRQSALDELGAARSIGLASELLELGTRFSRVDGFYDDLARRAEPATVAEAFRDGQAVSHVRRMRELREYVRADGTGSAKPGGSTTYLGSPSSNAMLRVYDKAAESGRATAGVRWEVQMRRQRAQRFALGLVAAGDGLGAYVLGCIRGLVDFRVRAGVVHGERTEMADWWAAIVRDAERITLNGPVKVDDLERRARWLLNQAAPSLALVGMAYGTSFLNELLRTGEERLTEQQLQLVRSHRPAGGAA